MALIHPLLDFALGPCVRKIKTPDKTLFLTFDDGPDESGTPQVLDLLAQHKAHATFFLIANKARQSKELVARIKSEGHTIGNHSLDHNYGAFFRRKEGLRAWIKDSERVLQDVTGQPSVGFRPPAGVRTPPASKIVARSERTADFVVDTLLR